MAKSSLRSLHVGSVAGMLAAPEGGCTDNVNSPSLTIHPPCSDEQVPKAIYPIQYPRIPGHEIIGEVVAVSPNEKKWKIDVIEQFQRQKMAKNYGRCKMVCNMIRRTDGFDSLTQKLKGKR